MYVLEGNIGSGKTTLLNNLAKHNIPIIPEPVDEWFQFKNNENQSIFELFNNDPTKYAFEFQMIVMLSRLKKYIVDTHTNTIFERSILTDKHIFVDTLNVNNTLTSIQSSIFHDWYNYVLKDVEKIKGIIYLRIDPKVCFQRIAKRNRSSENNIPFDYIVDLHIKHEEWLLNNNDFDVLVIDDNDEQNVEKIKEFIKYHSI